MTNLNRTVLQVLDSRTMGGIESHVFELCKGLIRIGWSVGVVFLNDYGPHPLKEKLAQEGIAIRCLDGTASNYWKVLRNQKPTVLHTHGYKAGFLGRFFAKSLGIPVISTYHAGEATKGKLALYTFLDRLSAGLSSPIAVSEKIAKTLPNKTLCMNNFVTVPNGLKKTYDKTVAFVGRLSAEKGPDLFCKLAKGHPCLTFKIYGDGPMRLELEKRYGAYVDFKGQVDMVDHWEEIDLLCMPSRFEGLPMAALEAMARTIPVLGSNAGSLPKLIDDQQNGWVVPLTHFEKFHEVLTGWQGLSQVEKKRLGEQAKDKVAKLYSPEVIIPEINGLYEKAMTG